MFIDIYRCSEITKIFIATGRELGGQMVLAPAGSSVANRAARVCVVAPKTAVAADAKHRNALATLPIWRLRGAGRGCEACARHVSYYLSVVMTCDLLVMMTY